MDTQTDRQVDSNIHPPQKKIFVLQRYKKAGYHFSIYVWHKQLTFSQTSPGFYMSAVQVF